MSEKKEVFLITTYFPPIQSIATNRMLAFAKYLDHTNFKITVVTLNSGSKDMPVLENVEVIRLRNRPFIGRLTHKASDHWIIRKSKSLYNKKYSQFVKYLFNNWKKKAVKKVSSLLLNEENTIFITSYAPVESHLVGLELKKEYPKSKWVADFRDELSLNPYNPPNRQADIEKVEHEILNKIDALVTISGVFVERFKKIANNRHIRYKEIRNGFDFEMSTGGEFARGDKFTINYFGNIYAAIDLSIFYSAVEEIIEKMQIVDIRINFIGAGVNYYIPKKLKTYIKATAKISHEQAIEQMKGSDALLLILPNIGWKGVYSGKLFEYLGAMRPIVAVTDPDDAAAQLIRDCNAGFIADFNSKAQIMNSIVEAYNLWEKRRVLNYNADLIFQHHRKNQVAKMSKLLLEL